MIAPPSRKAFQTKIGSPASDRSQLSGEPQIAQIAVASAASHWNSNSQTNIQSVRFHTSWRYSA